LALVASHAKPSALYLAVLQPVYQASFLCYHYDYYYYKRIAFNANCVVLNIHFSMLLNDNSN